MCRAPSSWSLPLRQKHSFLVCSIFHPTYSVQHGNREGAQGCPLQVFEFILFYSVLVLKFLGVFYVGIVYFVFEVANKSRVRIWIIRKLRMRIDIFAMIFENFRFSQRFTTLAATLNAAVGWNYLVSTKNGWPTCCTGKPWKFFAPRHDSAFSLAQLQTSEYYYQVSFYCFQRGADASPSTLVWLESWCQEWDCNILYIIVGFLRARSKWTGTQRGETDHMSMNAPNRLRCRDVSESNSSKAPQCSGPAKTKLF